MTEKITKRGIQQLMRLKRIVAFTLAMLMVVNMTDFSMITANAADEIKDIEQESFNLEDEEQIGILQNENGDEIPPSENVSPQGDAPATVSSFKMNISGKYLMNNDYDGIEVSLSDESFTVESKTYDTSKNLYEVILSTDIPVDTDTELTYTVKSARYGVDVSGVVNVVEATDAIATADFDSIENQGPVQHTLSGFIKNGENVIPGISISAKYVDGIESQKTEIDTTDCYDAASGVYSIAVNDYRSVEIHISGDNLEAYDISSTGYSFTTENTDIDNQNILIEKNKFNISGSSSDWNAVNIILGEGLNEKILSPEETSLDMEYGSDLAYKVEVTDQRYEIKELKIDGVVVGTNSGTFSNIKEIHTIEVATVGSALEINNLKVSNNSEDDFASDKKITGEISWPEGVENSLDNVTLTYVKTGTGDQPTDVTINKEDGTFEVVLNTDQKAQTYTFTATDMTDENSKKYPVIATTDAITIDKTAPQNVTAIVSTSSNYYATDDEAWMRDGAIITIDGIDAVTSIKYYAISTDENADLSKLSWSDYPADKKEITLSVKEDASNKNLFVWLKDDAENISEKVITTDSDNKQVKIDNTKPSEKDKIVKDKGWFSNKENKNSVIIADDLADLFNEEESGLKSYDYKVTDSNDNIVSENEKSITYEKGQKIIYSTENLEAGNYTYSISATDNVCNVSETIAFNFKVDTTAPQFTYKFEQTIGQTINNILFDKKEVTFTVTVTDSESKIDEESFTMKYDGKDLSKSGDPVAEDDKKITYKYVYVLKLDDNNKEKLKPIELSVSDNVTNERSENLPIEEQELEVLLENKAPDIKIAGRKFSKKDKESKDYHIEKENTSGEIVWCGNGTDLTDTFHIEDAPSSSKGKVSGINTDSIKVSIGGNELGTVKVTNIEKKTLDESKEEKTEIVTSCDVVVELPYEKYKESKEAVIKVTGLDNAGNENGVSHTVKWDVTAPEVSYNITQESIKEFKFGNYDKKAIQVEVTVEDQGSGITKESVEELTMTYGTDSINCDKDEKGVAKITEKIENHEYSVTFTLPISQDNTQKVWKINSISDRVNNESDEKEIVNSTEPTNSEWLVETTQSKVEVTGWTYNSGSAAREYRESTTKRWYNKSAEVTQTIQVTDVESGINDIHFYINGAEVTNSDITPVSVTTENGNVIEPYVITADSTKNSEYKITGAIYEINVKFREADKNDGHVFITANVTDNAGNTSNSFSTKGKNEIWFDNKAPDEKEITFKVTRDNKPLDYGNGLYNFGAYDNNPMYIEVDASKTEPGGAGVKDISLVFRNKDNSEIIYTTTSNSIIKKYKVPETVARGFQNGYITVEVTDNVENVSKPCTITYNHVVTNPSINEDLVFGFEKSAPTVQVTDWTYNAGSATREYRESTTKRWYNESAEVTQTIQVTDVESGINDIHFYINGAEVTNSDITPVSVTTENGNVIEPYVITADSTKNSEYKITSAIYKINVDIGEADKNDGHAFITANITDNAGNTSNSFSTKGKKEIWFDDSAPDYTGFTFNGEGTLDDAQVQHILQERDGTVVFGSYFKDDITVSFTVTDYARNHEFGSSYGSGIVVPQNIIYTLTDISGNVTKAEECNVSGNNPYECSFVVPANFKGQVTVSAIDRVENGSSQLTNGFIIETNDNHMNMSYARINLPEASHYDALGNPLFNQPQTIGIEFGDPYMGIGSAVYDYNSPYVGTNTEKLVIGNDWNGETPENQIGVSMDKERNIYTTASTTKEISENANDISLDLEMTDKTGLMNTKAEQKKISIDTIAPVIEITWDNNDVQNGKYYKADRTATVTVTERNFDPNACNFVTTGATPSISDWSHVAGGACNGSVHTDQCQYVATITFSTDSDYTFTFNTTDLAGNQTDYDQTFEFVVDKTAPVINVSYDNNNAQHSMYYKAARTGTIAITEHNFNSGDVQPTITSNTTVPGVNGWSRASDINTATVSYATDGDYSFNVAYTDLAGNPAAAYAGDRFIIDLTDPTLDIYDIVDKSANNGTVAPGVRYEDTNVDIDGVAIALKGANNGPYNLANGNKTQSGNGVDLKLNDFPHTEDVDDLYTMTATVSDLAGNQVEKKVMFSVNRFGSVYVLSDATKSLVKDKYSNKEEDIIVTEVNVDTLEEKAVAVTRDGELAKLSSKKDYKVSASGTDESWKRYVYTVDKANFEEEGNYTVSFNSRDRATNAQDNKVKDTPVEFVIDKTSPSAVVSGVANNKQYRANSRDVKINAEDNILLSKVTVTLDGETTEYEGKDLDSTDGVVSMNVGSSNKWQTMSVETVDAAGNTTKTDEIRFLITTNLFVQYVSNKPILFGSMGTVVALVALAIFLAGKKKEDDDNTTSTTNTAGKK